MIKTELRFIVKNSTPSGGIYGTSNNNTGGVLNSSFLYYTDGWSGNTLTATTATYDSLQNDGTYQSINEISGWEWKRGYMLAKSGYTEPLVQNIEGVNVGETYQVSFRVRDCNSGCTITPYLYGISGTTITADGQYNQYITITTGATDTLVKFIPNGEGRVGVTDIAVQSTNSQYYKVDLYNDEEINLTFQIQTNINNKGATYSKTLKVPSTSNNNKIFNMLMDESLFIDLGNLSGGTIFFNKKIPAGIYNESLELLTGYFEVQKAVIKDRAIEYEGVFYSTIKSLADVIGDKNLTGNDNPIDDISLDEYNHRFTMENIQATWGGALYPQGKGLYYPMIDYANVTSGNIYRMEQFKPCCYVKEVWDKVFEKAGFTYTSTFLNSALFKSLVMPMPNTRRQSELETDNTKFLVGLENYQDLELHLSGKTTKVAITRVNYDKESGGPFNNANSIYNTTTHSWTVTNPGTFIVNGVIRYGLKFTNTENRTWKIAQGQTGAYNYKVYLFVMLKRGNWAQSVAAGSVEHVCDGQCRNSGEWIVNEQEGLLAVTTNGEDSDTINVLPGDILYVESWVSCNGGFVRCTDGYTPVIGHLTLRMGEYDLDYSVDPSKFQIIPSDPANHYFYNEWVYANDTLPKMKQLQFLTSICNKFNLMFCEDRTNTNNLIIEPYDDFYYTGNTYLDWSFKVDSSKSKTIERIPYLIDKDVNFALARDNNDLQTKNYIDSYNVAFGDRTVKNPYYSNSIEKIEDEFSGTLLDYYGGTNIIVSRIYGEPPNDDGSYNDLPTDIDYTPRFLYRNFIANYNTTGVTLTPIEIWVDLPTTIKQAQTGETYTNLQLISTLNHYYPYAGYLDNPYYPTLDLNYGDSKEYIFNTSRNLGWLYWRNKISQYMNPNSKMITLYLKLNPTDIALLDFRKRIMINNNRYKINRIIEWKSGAGDSCKVELFQEAALNTDAYLTPKTWELKSGGGGRRLKVGPRPPRSIVLEPQKPIRYSGNWSEISGLTYSYPSGATFPDYNTYYSGLTSQIDIKNRLSYDSNSIVIGIGNKVTSQGSIINGDNNVIKGDNVVILGSSNNTVDDNKVLLIHSDGTTIATGVTNVVLINSSGLTITQTGKTYINNKDVDTLTDETYVLSVSATTISAAYAYTDQKSGETLTASENYVTNNYYDKTAIDSLVFSGTSGVSIAYLQLNYYDKNNVYNTGQTYTKAEVNTISGNTLTDSKTYTNTVSGNTLTNVATNYYNKTQVYNTGETYTKAQINTISAQTLADSKTYTNTKSGETLTYVSTNYYTKTQVNTISAQTLADANAYTNTKTGQTLSYVDSNYYTKTTADSTFATKTGIYTTYTKTTQTYTTNDEYIIGDSYNGTGRTITLADADLADGKVFILHDIEGNAGTNNIKIQQQPLGSTKINGALTAKYITTNYGMTIIWSDGTDWWCNIP